MIICGCLVIFQSTSYVAWRTAHRGSDVSRSKSRCRRLGYQWSWQKRLITLSSNWTELHSVHVTSHPCVYVHLQAYMYSVYTCRNVKIEISTCRCSVFFLRSEVKDPWTWGMCSLSLPPSTLNPFVLQHQSLMMKQSSHYYIWTLQNNNNSNNRIFI